MGPFPLSSFVASASVNVPLCGSGPFTPALLPPELDEDDEDDEDEDDEPPDDDEPPEVAVDGGSFFGGSSSAGPFSQPSATNAIAQARILRMRHFYHGSAGGKGDRHLLPSTHTAF